MAIKSINNDNHNNNNSKIKTRKSESPELFQGPDLKDR